MEKTSERHPTQNPLGVHIRGGAYCFSEVSISSILMYVFEALESQNEGTLFFIISHLPSSSNFSRKCIFSGLECFLGIRFFGICCVQYILHEVFGGLIFQKEALGRANCRLTRGSRSNFLTNRLLSKALETSALVSLPCERIMVNQGSFFVHFFCRAVHSPCLFVP